MEYPRWMYKHSTREERKVASREEETFAALDGYQRELPTPLPPAAPQDPAEALNLRVTRLERIVAELVRHIQANQAEEEVIDHRGEEIETPAKRGPGRPKKAVS